MKEECRAARWKLANAQRSKPKPLRACVWCGDAIPQDRSRRATCSESCAAERTRSTRRDYKRLQFAQDPDFFRRNRANKLARAAADPNYANDLRAAREEESRAYYEANKEIIKARRKLRLESFDDDEWRAFREAENDYKREWRSRQSLIDLARTGTELEQRLSE